MKAPLCNDEPKGFSLVELLTVIAIIGIVASMLLTVLGRAESRAKRVTCINNLREIGIAFHEFSDDHNGNYPMQVPVSQGGSQDFLVAAASMNGNFYFAYQFFEPLSNLLVNPHLLICPNDNRVVATNFATLRNANLSYFTTAFARVGDSSAVLAGDRNLTNNEDTPQCRLLFTPQNPLRWTGEIHQYRGNILFADDHVEEGNNQNPDRNFNAVMIFPPIIKTFNFGNPPTSSSPSSPPTPDVPNPVSQFSSNLAMTAVTSDQVTNTPPETNPPITSDITIAPKPVHPPEESGFPWWLLFLLLLLIIIILIARLLTRRKAERRR